MTNKNVMDNTTTNHKQTKQELCQKFKNNIFYYLNLIPAVTIVGLFFVIVAINLVKFSFTQYSGGIAGEQTIQNFIKVFTNSEFKEAYVRTLIFALIVTPLELIAAIYTASLINRKFKGRGFIRGIFMIPLALPVLITASAFFILFSVNGHVNSLLLGQYDFFPKVSSQPVSFIGESVPSFILVVLVKVWRDCPAAMLIILAGMQSIDNSQYEAARTMGSSRTQQLFFITIPHLAPAITAVLVLRSIEAWKEFVFPMILSPSFPLLSMVIDKYFNGLRDPGGASVVGLIMIVSILIFSQLLKLVMKLITKFLVRV